jgi:dUTP pyrophosphatase
MEENLEDLKKQLKEIEDLFGDSPEEDNVNQEDYESILSEFGLDINELSADMDAFQPTMPLQYSKSNEDVVSPQYAYPTDSGFDLYSTEELTIEPFGRVLVPTGLHFDIPDGYEIQVRSKSGLALKQGLMVLNSPGTVDCFSEDMKILTTDGEKTINEIKIGEIVYSFNEETLEIEKDIISQIFDTEKQEILIIETESGILEITPNSEIYTTNGIILAKNLKENDEIINFF